MNPPPLRPGHLVTRKRLVLWPRAELQAYYDRIGRVAYNPPVPAERLDDVRVVSFEGDDEVWIEVTVSQIKP